MKILKNTPWGTPQQTEQIAEGIVSYSTASHGGIKLDRKRNMGVPEYMRIAGGWYEEDCDWAIVATVYPDGFTETQREYAKGSFRCYQPDAYEKFYGVILQPGESRTKDEREFMKAHVADWLMIGIDWKTHDPSLPDDFVRIYARIGGCRQYVSNGCDPEVKSFLVPEAEYKRDRKFYTFAVDPTRHQEELK